jgi:NADH-quinone oxidoreductase subunit C
MPDEQKPEGIVPPSAGPSETAAEAPPSSKPPGAPEAPGPKPTPPPAAKAPAAAKPAPPKTPATMAATLWESELTRQLQGQFGGQILEFSTYLGQNFLVVKPEAAVPVIEYLKLEADFDYLVDVTAVDYPERPERFDLIYILYSFARNERIRIKTRIAENATPQTVTGVHVTANWLEREAYDMFGIHFAGHPNLQRILMPEEWQGHPLRKDYSIIRQDDRWVQENLGIESAQ